MIRGETVIAIDQGTTATKAFQLDAEGGFEPLMSRAHRQILPRAEWVEHDPEEILANVRVAIAAGAGARAIGIANQGETVVAWDAKTGRPLYNAIVWQDARTRAAIERLRAEGAEALTLERAGLPLDPYFAASKLRWLLDHAEGARTLLAEGRLRLATSDAFFIDRLTGVYATDVTTASRTGLMDLDRCQWDPELCRLFGVPIEALPPIRPSVEAFGETDAGIPLAASLVDQQASLFGHGCRKPGEAKITFGTGAFALAVTGERPRREPASRILPTVAWETLEGRVYAADGGVYNAGSTVDWLKSIGLLADYGEIDGFNGPSAIARGLAFVPALSGLGSPYWDRSAAGLWLGLGLETSRRDLLRAALEGIVLRTAQVLERLGAGGLRNPLSVDGGLVANASFLEMLAAASRLAIAVPATADLTAYGAGLMALLGSGLVTGIAALPPVERARLVEPGERFGEAERARFADAVERSRGWRPIV